MLIQNRFFMKYSNSILVFIACFLFTNSNSQNIVKNKALSTIDWKHWKVTLPIGAPTEIGYPEILNYTNNDVLKKFMYNDVVDGSVVFYAYPGAITSNATHSRTELREQMEPGQNTPNWTFAQGARMKGTLSMDSISKDDKGIYHSTIIMQIHGRLTDAQRKLIGQRDNNAAPVLKISWEDGNIKVKTKMLKDSNASASALLFADAWKDNKSFTFKQKVGFNKFSLEVKVSDGRLEVILNNHESVVYEGFHMKQWGVFENYFKAGNYLQSNDVNAFAKVKYYALEVSH